MSLEKNRRWSAAASLLGALAWAVIALLAGRGLAPFGLIELLFLLAVLVVTPLGLALAETAVPSSFPGMEGIARVVQPLAAASAVIAIWTPPGERAALFALPWLVVAGLVGLSGALTLLRGPQSELRLISSIARIDLSIGAGWFLLSRLGIQPMGLQEPIILLTGVHFHFSGFATALIAASNLRLAGKPSRTFLASAVLVATIPFVIAAGFVFSPWLRMSGAIAFSLALAIFAFCLFRSTTAWTKLSARAFARLACASVLAGMALASAYAVSEYWHKDWLTIPRMAGTHGLINALGFVLPALLGLLMEFGGVSKEDAYENRNYGRHGIRGTAPGERTVGIGAQLCADRARPRPARLERLEFAARDFFDR